MWELGARVTTASRHLRDLGAVNCRLWNGSGRVPRRGAQAALCGWCDVLCWRLWQTLGWLCCFGFFCEGGVLSTVLVQLIHIHSLLATIKSLHFRWTENSYFYHGQHFVLKSLEILLEGRIDSEPWFAITFQHVLCGRVAGVCLCLTEVCKYMFEVKYMQKYSLV